MAAAGDLDAGFGNGGRAAVVAGAGRCLAVQGDGKIVVGGDVESNGSREFMLVRYLADGSLDLGFGDQGVAMVAMAGSDEHCRAMAVQEDGKILLVGQSEKEGRFDLAVVRYRTDGTLDDGFGRGGRVIHVMSDPWGRCDSYGSSIAVREDGRLVVAGGANLENDGRVFCMVVSFREDGTPDPEFGNGGLQKTGEYHSETWGGNVVVQPDGGVWVATISNRLGGNRLAWMVIPPAGTATAPLGISVDLPGLQGESLSLAGLSGGDAVVAAIVTVNDSPAVALMRYGVEGGLDLKFGNEGQQFIGMEGLQNGPLCVYPQTDGKILVAGQSAGGAPGTKDWLLMRCTSEGLADVEFGEGETITTDFSGGDDTALALAAQADGRILAAGTVTAGATTTVALARYANVLAPSAIPAAATDLATTTATVHGLVNANAIGGGGATSVVFEVSLDGVTFAEAPATPEMVSGSDWVPVSASVGDLKPGAKHYFRLKAASSTGATTSLANSFTTVSNDASLFGLSLSAGTLSPAFDPEILAYTVTAPYEAQGVRITPVKSSAGATMAAGGKALAADASVFVSRMRESITPTVVTVTAEDGTVRTYSVRVRWAEALPGVLDWSFNRGEFDYWQVPAGCVATSVITQPDSKIVIGGYSHGFYEPFVMRINLDGTADSSFGTLRAHDNIVGATFLPAEEVISMALQSDGKILATGFRDAYPPKSQIPVKSVYVTRLDQLGKLDTSFGNNGTVTTLLESPSRGTCVAVQGDGRILVAGHTEAGKVVLMRHLQNGSLDPSFGVGGQAQNPGTISEIQNIAIQADGNIVIAGTVEPSDLDYKMVILRYTAAGDLDTTFGAGGWVYINSLGTADEFSYCMALQSDGRIVVGGFSQYFGGLSDFVLARFTGNGAVDPTFGVNGRVVSDISGGHDLASGMVLQKDDKIVIIGAANTGSNYDFVLARYLPNGGLDEDFGDGGRVLRAVGGLHDLGVATALLPDGRIVAAGYYYTAPTERSTGIILGIFHAGEAMMPEIAVSSAEKTTLTDGEGWDFGNTGLNGQKTQVVTVTNRGTDDLENLAVTLEGTDAAEFQITGGLPEFLPPGKGVSIAVAYRPRGAGSHAAVLCIASNDPDEPVLNFPLSGVGIANTALVTTVSHSSRTAVSSASLDWSINVKGTGYQMWVEYGLTASYGMKVPLTTTDQATMSVSAWLSGLQQRTTYHYRLRAANSDGEVVGPDKTFTTLNQKPIPQSDTFYALPGEMIELPVQANDFDPGDLLTISAVKVVHGVNSTEGKLTLVNGVLRFAAASQFKMGYSWPHISYTIKDPAGATATSYLHIHLRTIGSISPDSREVRCTGGTHQVAVRAADTDTWLVTPSASWISTSVASDTGDGTVTITVQPNMGTKARSGHVRIGGKLHVINQQGLQAPELFMPGWVPAAVVGGDYLLEIPSFSAPITYAVTNLPPGLVMDKSGVISGRPTKAGVYEVVIKGRNAAGTVPSAVVLTIDVAPLPGGLVGLYHGLAGGEASLNGQLGSRFEMSTSSLGAVTGRIITGATALAFTGKLEVDANEPGQARFRARLARRGLAPVDVDVWLNAVTNDLEGTLIEAGGASVAIGAWRQVWKAPARLATVYKGAHSFWLGGAGGGAEVPAGYGFGGFTVDEKTGNLKVAGKLADGSGLVTSTFVGKDGQVLVYQPLYGNKGSFAGAMQMSDDHRLSGAPVWYKPEAAANARDLVYRDGFGPVAMEVSGGLYEGIPAGGLMMGLESAGGEGMLNFAGGGLVGAGNSFEMLFSLTNSNAKGYVNQVVFPVENDFKVKMTLIQPMTGAFAGEFTLPGPTRALDRKAAYQGQVVKEGGEMRGYGFFLLPETGTSPASARKWSGRVVMKPAAP